MAIETPLHQQRVRLKNQRHLIHRAMARRAADAFAHMNAVIEVREITEAMHFHPFNRFVRAVAFAHRLEVAGVIEQNGVAVHAGFGGRNACGGGIFHGSMTVAAINAVVAHVMLVAELHWLLARNILPC